MRILYTNFHEGDGGGHTTYIASLARALGARHELHVASPAGSRVLLNVVADGSARPLDVAFGSGLATLGQQRADIAALRRCIREQRIEVVHVNGARDHRFAMRAVSGLRQRPKIVFTKHNSKPSNSLGNTWRARFGTDRVIAVSAHTRTMLLDSPYRRLPIDVIRNGVDLQHFAPGHAEQGRALRAGWTQDPNALVLVSNAGTDDHKGWIDLVRAVASLPAEQRARVHIAIAGRPPEAHLTDEVARLGMATQVHAVGLLADTRPFIAAGDAGFVLSYDVETISFACREMMAMALPVMVSDYAGLPENIAQGEDGWVVPVRNVAAIATQVQALLRERDSLPGRGAAARAHAEREFSVQGFAEATEASYRAALAGR